MVSAAVFVLLPPFAKLPVTPVKMFIPAYQSVLFMNGLITTVLLFGQYVFLRSRALYCLACGYLFTACIGIAHSLTYPNVFSEAGSVGN